MTCKDAIDIIADFLDQVLASDAAAALEAHLRECAPCRAYLNTYRKTRGLAREVGRVDMPEELKSRLHRFMLDQLNSPRS